MRGGTCLRWGDQRRVSEEVTFRESLHKGAREGRATVYPKAHEERAPEFLRN